MKYEIAKKFLAVRRRVPSEPTFRSSFRQVDGRSVSIASPMSLLAMKYAIGGIFFLGVWVWNEFAPGPSMPRTSA